MILLRQPKLHAWQQFPCPCAGNACCSCNRLPPQIQAAPHVKVLLWCAVATAVLATPHCLACSSHVWQLPTANLLRYEQHHAAHTCNSQSPPASTATQPRPAAAATTPASTVAQAGTSSGARGWPAGVLASAPVLLACRTPRGLLPCWRQDGQSPAHARQS